MRHEIVGRSEEHALLLAFLENQDALPGAFVLAGAPGAGKTTLWREGIADARERSYRVLSSAPAPSETKIAFSSLRDLLEDSLAATLPGLPPPQRRALEVALLLEDDESPATERGAIAVALLAVLRKLALDGPVLIAVDDAQWLDTPSSRALEFALRRLVDEQVGVLLAHRAGDLPPGLDQALGEHALRIDLGPLSLGALHQLLHARLGLSLSRPLLGRVHETSGGNPLYALEIGRALRARGREVDPSEELPLPQTLKEAIEGRLTGLPEETREALVAVAVWSGASISEIQVVTDVEDAWAALQPALEAHIVELENDRLRFTHPMLATVVIAQADPRVRRALHGRIAHTLSDLEARARHRALAAENPDEEAAELLEHAARRAGGRGSPAGAAELFELARGLTPADAEKDWARRTLDAAAAHAEGGEEWRGQQLAREVVERAGAGPQRARALGLLGFWLTDIELCRQALVEAGDDRPLQAWLEYVQAYAHYMRGELEPALEHARAAVATGGAAGDREIQVRALTLLADLEGTMCAGDPLVRLQEAIDLEADPERIPTLFSPQTYLGRWYKRRDELSAGRVLLERQRQRAFDVGDEEAAAILGFLLCELEWRAGEWKRADAYAREYRESFDLDHANVLGREAAYWAPGLVAAGYGRLDVAREHAEAGVGAASAAERQGWLLRNTALLGFIELSRGDYAKAHEILAPLPEGFAELGVRDPSVYLVMPDVIEALIGVGDLAQAEVEIDELEARGRALDRPWALSTAARSRGLLLAARGDLPGALTALEQAIVEHERLPMPFERGRTLLALGQTQRRMKKRQAARQTLGQAVAVFEELGAVLWEAKAREGQARIGGRAPAGSALTATERRVAEQVAQGRSNKEAAAALFVTVKTVEANLSRVYAKLGIHSRSELASHLDPHGPAGKV